MFRRAAVVAVLAALVGALASLWISNPDPDPEPPAPKISGRNNTVLYLTDSSSGLSNNHIASAFALLESRPDIQIYWGSFGSPPIEPRLQRVFQAAELRNPNVIPISFHDLGATSTLDVLRRKYGTLDKFITDHGLKGYDKMLPIMETILMPWKITQYFALFQKTMKLIDSVDPAVIVVDGLPLPFVDAARDSNRLFAVLNPNVLVNVIGHCQPRGEMFWKYPALASGHQFPVRAHSVLQNIWMQIRFTAMIVSPKLTAARTELKALGIKDPLNLQTQWDDVPLISGDFPEASLPLSYYPPNVTTCGPMVLDTAPAEQQSLELFRWLSQGPSTMLVCLGSDFKYDRKMALEMGAALLRVLDETDVQILWKFEREEEERPFSAAHHMLDRHIRSGRIKIQKWLDADPVSLVNTGMIDVWVHHGSASSYYEAAMAGVKQVIVPMWLDQYNYAQIAEYVGVGIWAGKDMAPVWDDKILRDGFVTALSGGKADAMQKKADALRKAAARYSGRDCAARKIARMAGTGH
ncbi:hypothetical protein BJX76DRAFT_338304 [Aspergillus varians]